MKKGWVILGAVALVLTITAGGFAGSRLIGSADIKDRSIKGKDIASNAVGARLLADGSVGAADIADGSVGAADIADGSVGAADIADGGVGGAEVADGSVGAADIADNGVGGAEIASGAVGAADVATDSLGATQIAASGVGGSEIADGSVGSADIGDNAVGAAEIASEAVGSGDLSDDVFTTLSAGMRIFGATGGSFKADAATETQGVVASFPVPASAAPATIEVIEATDSTTTNCAGSFALPSAASGKLCIYTAASPTNVTANSFAATAVGKFGFKLTWTSVAAGATNVEATWAYMQS